MSGFEALGAAGSIFQFIGYGIKISEKAIAVYQGKDQLRELQHMTSEYRTANEAFINGLKLRSSGPDSGEALLAKTAEQCQKTATELLQLIDSLVLRVGEKSRRTAFKLAIKSEFRKSDVQAKKTALQDSQRQCQDQLFKLMSDRQFALADALARTEHRQAESNSVLARRMTELKKEIIAAVTSSIATESPRLQQMLANAHKLGTSDLPREQILSSLKYTEMRYRRDRIIEPGRSTFEWIFNARNGGHCSVDQAKHLNIGYVPWLKDGKGVFWITGKAGSGKSTLMKYICNDARTLSMLKRWAKGRELLTASHFFWYLGSPMEKSYLGLLQSILHQLLQKCPDLIPSVCKDRWSDEKNGRDTTAISWTPTELLQCLESFFTGQLEIKSRQICFCFFIDGLDEYDGDYEVVDALVRLVRSGNIKICASSRPWNKFEVAFADSKLRGDYLELHQHTRGDIEKVVESELTETLVKLNRATDEWKALVTDVIDRAEGVFLWVTLVLKKELRPMLEARESLASLRRRLEVVPSDLHQYFERIFQRIWSDTKYRQDTARIFKSCIAAHVPLPISTIDLLIDPSFNSLNLSMRKYKLSTIQARREALETRKAQLNSRCQDLLSVSDFDNESFFNGPFDDLSTSNERAEQANDITGIQFLHRSVRDFLDESREISQELDTYAGPDFDVHLTLSMAYLFMISKAAKIWHWNGEAVPDPRKFTVPNVARDWSFSCLRYLSQSSSKISAEELVGKLDANMQSMYTESGLHWSNPVFDDEEQQPSDEIHAHTMELDRDILAHLIELGVMSYVDTVTKEHPQLLQAKKSRPYLDYALQPHPASLERLHGRNYTASHASHSSIQPSMIKLLLERGSDPNQMVEGRTRFDAWLQGLYDGKISNDKPRQITWLLIRLGRAKSVAARVESQKRTVEKTGMTARYHKKKVWHEEETVYETTSMEMMLVKCFGKEEARAMCEAIAQNDAADSWWGWASSFWN